jgi:hypothetical protein
MTFSEAITLILGVSLAFRAGGSALGKFFGVAPEKLLSGRLLTGEVGGRQIAAQFSKSGDVLTADVIGIWNTGGQQGLATLTRDLYKNIVALAQEHGASSITINAVAVVNKDLEKALLARGWTRTTVNVEGFGKTEALSFTFKVPNK